MLCLLPFSAVAAAAALTSFDSHYMCFFALALHIFYISCVRLMLQKCHKKKTMARKLAHKKLSAYRLPKGVSVRDRDSGGGEVSE